MADRHDKNPITFRPNKAEEPWLESYARMHGLSERSVLHQALASFRMTSEQGATWTVEQFLDLITVILEILDIPFAAGYDEEQKRNSAIERRLNQVLSTLRWLRDNSENYEGHSLRYMVENLREAQEVTYKTLGYETDYAVVVAKRDGKTVEEAREWLEECRKESAERNAARSATDAIRTEIEA